MSWKVMISFLPVHCVYFSALSAVCENSWVMAVPEGIL